MFTLQEAIRLMKMAAVSPPRSLPTKRKFFLPRAIGRIALGRKNYLFAGSEAGGQNLAILLSLVVSCKQNKINPQAYLEDVLTRIHTTPAKSIDTLLPHLWGPEEK